MTNAQSLNRDIEVASAGGNQTPNQTKSAGKLGFSINDTTKLREKIMNTLDATETRKEEDTLLLAAASTPALGNAFRQRKMTLEKRTPSTLLSNDIEKQFTHHASSPLGISVG